VAKSLFSSFQGERREGAIPPCNWIRYADKFCEFEQLSKRLHQECVNPDPRFLLIAKYIQDAKQLAENMRREIQSAGAAKFNSYLEFSSDFASIGAYGSQAVDEFRKRQEQDDQASCSDPDHRLASNSALRGCPESLSAKVAGIYAAVL
jgi:hypothetical protein